MDRSIRRDLHTWGGVEPGHYVSIYGDLYYITEPAETAAFPAGSLSTISTCHDDRLVIVTIYGQYS